MTVVYEVTLSVQADSAAAFRKWLGEHIHQMLALPGFVGARLMEVEDASDPGRAVYCTHYELLDRRALDHYLQIHAARMRADAIARFGDRVAATRRILSVLDY